MKPNRIGVMMEFMDTDLRKAIKKFPKLKERIVQFSITKKIASGINFLHSLNPHILV